MGMFDTIYLKTPLACPGCGEAISEVQTHEFGETMRHYSVGSLVTASPVVTGIVKETLWCSTCSNADRSGESPLYLVIWHSILAGVEQDLEKAEKRLAAVDRLDLIGWLDENQREAARWRRKYNALYHDLKRWHEHLQRVKDPEPAVEGENAEVRKRREACRHLLGPPEEVLNAPDPLAAIIERNSPEAEDEPNGF